MFPLQFEFDWGDYTKHNWYEGGTQESFTLVVEYKSGKLSMVLLTYSGGRLPVLKSIVICDNYKTYQNKRWTIQHFYYLKEVN